MPLQPGLGERFMQRKLLFIFALALCLFLFARQSMAAAETDEIVKAGAEVKTKYFSLVIPDGWLMPHSVREIANSSVSAVFAKENSRLAIAINIIKADAPAKEMAAITAANMRKTGIKTTEPVEQNGLWVMRLEGKAMGKAWFGANNGLCSVTSIFGSDLKPANRLLESIKDAPAGLLPANVE